MTDLIANLTTGKGTWTYVLQLMQAEKWEKVFLVTNQFGAERFRAPREATFILIDENKSLPDIVADIKKQLDKKTSGTDIALNFISGTGKEHMAVLSAAFSLGLSIRLVGMSEQGVVEV